MRNFTLAATLVVLGALPACAGTDPGFAPDDFSLPSKNDLTAIKRDLTLPAPDLTLVPDLGCALGTPDHCGTCMTVCAPGMDTAGTLRSCSGPGAGATCDFQCQGEFYDVNGRDDDGCESADAPVQDTPQSAVPLALQDIVDPMNPKNVLNYLGKIYSDGRVHTAAPMVRTNGREDWFALNVTGAGDPNSTLVACLSISSLPADNQFEVCIADVGKTLFEPKACKVAAGMVMMSVCVQPPALGDSGNPFYVRVRKLSGTPSVNGYALYLKH